MVVAVYRGRRMAESEPSKRIRLDANFEADYSVPEGTDTSGTTQEGIRSIRLNITVVV